MTSSSPESSCEHEWTVPWECSLGFGVVWISECKLCEAVNLTATSEKEDE